MKYSKELNERILKTFNFNGIKIIENEAIPDGVFYVSPNTYLMLKDPEKWAAMQEKSTQNMVAEVNAIFGDKD